MMKKFWISLLLIFSMSAVFAAAPEKLNYQGYLQQKVDGVFKPAVDGDYSVTFKLYDVATGGTALWTSAKTVTVVDGIYSTVLGEAVALSGLAFDKPYYLGVTVGSDSEMEPRQAITASAYAVQSKKTEKVGTLTNGKWCNSDGNVINCEQDAPSDGASSDTTPPIVGNDGTITTSTSGGNITLNWTAASDDTSAATHLEYAVVYSMENNISTVADAEENGIPAGLSWASNINSRTISGLEPGVNYYFNILVKDQNSNKAVYSFVVGSSSASFVALYGDLVAYGGDMGGRIGINEKCASSGNKPLGFENYAGFISVNATDTIAGRQAFSGLDPSLPIKDKTGVTTIADNWADLLDGSIDTSLQGAGLIFPSEFWWSGSNIKGELAGTCSGWTFAEDNAGVEGQYGRKAEINGKWISQSNNLDYCADPATLICVAW